MKPLKWFFRLSVAILPVALVAYKPDHQPSKKWPVIDVNSLFALNNILAAPGLTNPADITVNVCGTSTVLTSTNVPGYSNPSWNDGSTGTSLTVTSSGTYWWQEIGTNIVTNGDFSSGDSGFSSSYVDKTATHSQSALFNESTYAVGTNPNAYHSSFTQFGDHTSGSGNMLIVNGAPTANVTVWKETISITANTDYVFSTWVTSASPSNPALLQFSINGSSLGSAIALSSTASDGTWQYFTTTWNSGSTHGNVPIALVNQNTVASGNDFAVDDIVFAPVYRQNVIVNLNPVPVLALTGPVSVCDHYDLTKTISGYDPATYNYTFTDASNNTVTTPQAITQSGTYTITEQNKTTGCTSLPQHTTITIIPNPAKPGITSL